MLPVPNLDDRLFEQMVRDARQAIPKLIPEWTDENYHDPGITLIELFSWLTEMQQYQLNRITTKNERKYLKLLGISLQESLSAHAQVTFSGIGQADHLPQGLKLAAKDQLFETEERTLLIPAKLEKIIVRTDKGANDYTSLNQSHVVTFYAFGQEAKSGNSLFLGFDQALPQDQLLSVMLHLFEDYPVRLNSIVQGQHEFIPSASVSWQYYGLERATHRETPTWLPLDISKDETHELTHSGRINFRIAGQMKPTVIYPANDKGRYWLCCTLEKEGYELSPKLEKITLNTVPVVQRDTLSELLSFDGTGLANQVIEVDTYLSLYGEIRVQVEEQDGLWRYWQEVEDLDGWGREAPVYQRTQDPSSKKVILTFGNGDAGRIPDLGQRNIRVIAYDSSFSTGRMVGRSDGLPNQRLELKGRPLILQTFMLQVGIQVPGSKELLWQDWYRVEDFDHSSNYDRHYAVNVESSELLFGNHESGMIPEATEVPNICIISYQLGGGERGNVQQGMIKEVVGEEWTELAVTNHYPASGGKEAETTEQAKLRLQKELAQQDRAVTAQDFEAIALATPGLRVARVKALPLYTVGLKDYPQNKAPAQVTVVVVPYSEAEQPMPSQGFLATVQKHVDRHRLITTEVHTIAPAYIRITVHAVVIVKDHLQKDTLNMAAVLQQLLQPLDRDGYKGWEFGRTVYKGDIYGALNKLNGVEYVQDLWLEAEGKGIQKEGSGNIIIPAHGLVYSGEHQIEVISKADL